MDSATLAARAAIANCLARHSRGVDRADRALLAAAYHPDATVEYGFFAGPAAELAEILAGALAGGPVTLHRTSQASIRVAHDSARGESYVIAYARDPGDGGGVQRLIGGRYLDRFRFSGGEWRIAHRAYVMDWNMNGAANELPPAGVHPGAHRAEDPASAHWSAFRAIDQSGDAMAADLDAALARAALQELNARYARGVDRGDAALLASVFHPDAEIVTGILDGTGATFPEAIVAMVRANLKSTFHAISNEYFEIAGDRAQGESYVIAHNITAAQPASETLTGGRYLDRYERREGTWRIARRHWIYDWSITRPVSEQTDGMYAALTVRGGYAPDDPSDSFWAS